jgi:hypothetical protein
VDREGVEGCCEVFAGEIAVLVLKIIVKRSERNQKSKVHFSYELLLCLRAEVAMDGRLYLEEVLDYILYLVCGLRCQWGYS